MHFEEYKASKQALYGDFADTIRFILDRAIKGAPSIPRPQAIQPRPKSIESLERKLRERSLLESTSIEEEIRDLAGVRLIFYTNGDVNRFLSSRLIVDNFTIENNATRVHHPTAENEGAQYRGIHYTVTLSAARSSLPEYARFEGLRCEIQIQTILNHAWSETTHDILYKPSESTNFGSKGFDAIKARMRRVMDEYLLPAGYEIQKAQYDYQRIMEGKALFDRGSLEALKACSNNNERYDLLLKLDEYVIPNYDDLAGVFPEIKSVLFETLAAAQTTPLQPIETPFGNLAGKSADDIARLVIIIFDKLRYVDVEGSFSAFLDMLKSAQNRDWKKDILGAIERLAHYDLNVIRQVGYGVQDYLSERLDRLPLPDLLAQSTVAFTVWRELLNPEFRGESSSHDKITFTRGSLNPTKGLAKIRGRAISGLFKILGAPGVSAADRRTTISILGSTGRLPNQSGFSDELCRMVLGDCKTVTDRMAEYVADLPYDLQETVEEQLLFEYRRAKELAENENFEELCRQVANGLVMSVLALKDKLNTDDDFVRYKTLVSYEAVFPPDWEGGEFDREAYRLERVEEFVENINESNFGEWRAIIARCAATESNDLATFPAFCKFIVRLSQRKPSLVVSLLSGEDPHIANFLPDFFYGLSLAVDRSHYTKALADATAEPTKHLALIRHYRKIGPPHADTIKPLLESAIARNDDIAVIESLVLAIEHHKPITMDLKVVIFSSALEYLTFKQDARWVRGGSFLQQKSFFEGLGILEAQSVLTNLTALDHVGREAERILVYIADQHPELVWRFLGRRLDNQRTEAKKGEAVPYRFHGLEVPLSRDPQLAVRIARAWHTEGDPLFRFAGARLLSNVFRGFPDDFGAALSSVIAEDGTAGADFVLAILENYHAEEAVHEVARQIVEKLPDGDARLARVEIALANTGVVKGEFGMVEALRERKARLLAWLTDGRSKVRQFAKSYIPKLDVRIAAEQRSAEEEAELWKRSFDEKDSDPE